MGGGNGILIEQIEGGFDKNFTYVVGCPTTKKGALIDACTSASRILEVFEHHHLTPECLLITHAHGDHIVSAQEFVSRTNAIVYAFGEAAQHSFQFDRYHPLSDGDQVTCGRMTFDVFHTPGHAPDSLCLLAGSHLFTGDTLFAGRTGRTVHGGGDTRALYQSIERLKALPPETVIYPGHDYGPSPTSTIGQEQETNTFLQADSEEAFIQVMEEYERSRLNR